MINFDKNFSFFTIFLRFSVLYKINILCLVKNTTKSTPKLSPELPITPQYTKKNRINREHFKKDFTQGKLHVNIF